MTKLQCFPQSLEAHCEHSLNSLEVLEGRVDKIAETWVSIIGDETALEEEHVLFQHGN
jgi:hypothetical protein